MIIESSPVGSSKSNGIVEKAIQFVQGMISERGCEDRRDAHRVAVDPRINMILVNEVRSRS